MQTFVTFARTIAWTLICAACTRYAYLKEPYFQVYMFIACISGYIVCNNIWVLGNVCAYKLTQYDLNVFRRKLSVNCNSTKERYNIANILNRYGLNPEGIQVEIRLLKEGWSYLEIEFCFKTGEEYIDLKQKFLGYVIEELDKHVLEELKIAI